MVGRSAPTHQRRLLPVCGTLGASLLDNRYRLLVECQQPSIRSPQVPKLHEVAVTPRYPGRTLIVGRIRIEPLSSIAEMRAIPARSA